LSFFVLEDILAAIGLQVFYTKQASRRSFNFLVGALCRDATRKPVIAILDRIRLLRKSSAPSRMGASAWVKECRHAMRKTRLRVCERLTAKVCVMISTASRAQG
jgi:hypothetical protein